MGASSVLTNAADLSSGWYTASQPGASRTQPVGNSQTLTCWESVQCQVDHVVALSFEDALVAPGTAHQVPAVLQQVKGPLHLLACWPCQCLKSGKLRFSALG